MYCTDTRCLSPQRKGAIRGVLRQGKRLYRGIREHGPSDPGDLGIGAYYSSLKSRARGYGRLTEAVITLQNPLVLTQTQAYALVDDHFHTCCGEWARRKQGATAATRMLRCLGFDGIVAVNLGPYRTDEWEVVVFPTPNAVPS